MADQIASLGQTQSCDGVAWDRFTEPGQLEAWNERFAKLTASQRVACALQTLPETHILTSSFGAQAAVCLHLLTAAKPDIPVVVIDTGYLFPETYQFIEQLSVLLDLNLRVCRAAQSPSWQEAIYGQRWQQGVAGLEQYNYDNKVEPMQRALQDLRVGTWFTGVRRSQASSRAATPFIQHSGSYFKVAPIADWTDRDVHKYLKEHDLPYHPLWEQGYVSIGDVHTTRSIHEAGSAEQTRFFGLKRECGLHETL